MNLKTVCRKYAPLTYQKGFSLAELMIVIAIVGILSAIAIPNIISYRQNAQLRASAADLLGTFRKAQIYSIKSNQSTTIEFDATAGTATVKDGSGATVFEYAMKPAAKMSGVTFTANKTGFTPRGFPVGINGGVEIHPASSDSKVAYKVTLTNTGHARLLTSTDGGSNFSPN